MKNKSFTILLIIAAIMVFGAIAENAQLVITPEKSEVKIDTNEMKNKMKKAGIIPHDAMYWKEL